METVSYVNSSLHLEIIFNKVKVDSLPPILCREPGSKWAYSSGLDYAGLMVCFHCLLSVLKIPNLSHLQIERVSNMKLEEYFQRHIFEPLGIKEISFHLNGLTRPRRVPQWYRQDDGSLKLGEYHWRDPMPVDFGGAGLFGTAKEYVEILQSLLQDKCPLLSEQSLSELFSPQLDPEGYANDALRDRPDPSIRMNLGSVPRTTRVSWGLAGVLTLEDISNARKSHSLHWSGLPNCFWVSWLPIRYKDLGYFANISGSSGPIAKLGLALSC